MFKGEVKVKLVDLAARLEALSLFLDLGEVANHTVSDLGNDIGVLFRKVDNGSETRTRVSDETMDEVVELVVVDDALHLLSDLLHVLHQLVDVVEDLHLGRGVAETFIRVAVETNNSLKGILPIFTVHFVDDEFGGFLVDSNLGLDHHVIDEADKCAQVVKVGLSQSNHTVFKVILHLLKHHGLVLGSLTNLCVLKILLVADGARVGNVSDKSGELLADDLINFLVVVALGVVAVLLLLVHEVLYLVVLLTTEHEVSRLGLHVVQNTVYVNESALVVGASLDQLLGEELASLCVGAVAYVSFPETEDLADEVVFEEVHGSEHIEHGLLLHPV